MMNNTETNERQSEMETELAASYPINRQEPEEMRSADQTLFFPPHTVGNVVGRNYSYRTLLGSGREQYGGLDRIRRGSRVEFHQRTGQ